MNPERGYATTYALVSISVLSLVAALSLGPEMQASRRIKALEEQSVLSSQLDEAIANVIVALLEDPTPEADSFTDPVWTLIESDSSEEISLTLVDISTGINLNAYNLDYLDETSLVGSLGGLETISIIRDARQTGFIREDSEVTGIVPEDTLGRIFSYYGYFNPNTTDPETLRTILTNRLEEQDEVERILSSLNAAKRNGRVAEEDIAKALGASRETVAPILSPVPMININTADRSLIDAVFSFKDWGKPLEDPMLIVGSLWMDRLAGEVIPSDLIHRLKDEDDINWIFDLIGTKTWFWRVTATHESGYFKSVVVAQLPEIDGTRHLQVVERTRGYR